MTRTVCALVLAIALPFLMGASCSAAAASVDSTTQVRSASAIDESKGSSVPLPAAPAASSGKSEAADGTIASALKKMRESVISYALGFAGLAVLTLIGWWWSPDILRFVCGNKFFNMAPGAGWKARVRVRTGRLYMKRAIQAHSKNNSNLALALFDRGMDIIEKGLRQVRKERIDDLQFQRILDDRALAPLYGARAWADLFKPAKLDAAIASADRALQLDPDFAEARIARALAKLQRGQPGDAAQAESDIEVADRAGQKRGSPYLWAQYAHAEMLRQQGEYAKAVSEFTAMAGDAERISGIRAGRGVAYYALGNWADALADLTWVIEREPNHSWAIYRADALRFLERLEEALDDCRKILERCPEDPQAYYVSGLVLHQQAQSLPEPARQEKLELALKRLRAARDIAVNNKGPVPADVYNKLVEILNALGREEEAARWLADLRNSPASSGMAAEASTGMGAGDPQGRFGQGWLHMQMWFQTKDESELQLADKDFAAAAEQEKLAALSYCARAWVRYWQHAAGAPMLDEALNFSRVALERDATQGFAHHVRGWILMAKGQYADARNEFSAAIQFRYATSDTYFGLAEANRLLAQHQIAITNYANAIEKNDLPLSGRWRPYHGRALSHAELREWQPALDDYQAAIEYAKKTTIAQEALASMYSGLGWACYELRRDGDMEEAFNRAVGLAPKSSYVQLELGGVRLYCGQYDEAIDRFSSAIALDPESSVGYVNRGLTHIYRGHLETALSDLDIAIEKNPKDSAAWHTRGWARLRQRDWQNAIADFDQAIALVPTEPFRFNDRALALWWRKDRNGALKDLRTVLEIKAPKPAASLAQRLREDAVIWGATAEDWTHAVDSAPNDFLPYLGRGISRWLAGDLQRARDDLTRAGAIDARSPEVQGVLERIEPELAAISP